MKSSRSNDMKVARQFTGELAIKINSQSRQGRLNTAVGQFSRAYGTFGG